MRALGFKVTALEPSADPYLASRSGAQRGRQGQTWGKGLTSSNTPSTPGPRGRVAKCVAIPQIPPTSVCVHQR